MKKSLFILSGILMPFLASAQDETGQEEVDITHIPGSYYLYITPNGTYLADKSGDAGIRNVKENNEIFFPTASFGLGNTISNDGWAVGSVNDQGVVFNYKGKIVDEEDGFKYGEVIYPEALREYWFCDINAITPDGTKITGLINNLKIKEDRVWYVPFIADLDAAGNVSNVTVLPYPDKDFFGAAPQYSSAVWISADGKTVAGHVTDNIGWYNYPIVYQQDNSGNWSYTLPSKPLFNPDHIELPDNPYAQEPPVPNVENYMHGNKLTAYKEAYQQYLNGTGNSPDPFQYMDPEEQEEYNQAVADYDAWEEDNARAIYLFFKAYDQIMATSPTFSMNDYTIHPDGSLLYCHGGKINENGDQAGLIYKFDLISESIEELHPPISTAFPRSVLADGMLIVTTPLMEFPSSWFMLPGTTEFVTPQAYYQTVDPTVSEWFDQALPQGTGAISLSDDKSVMVTAVLPYQMGDNYDYGDENIPGSGDGYLYSSYILRFSQAGVESVIADPEGGVYKVYNLQGVKVLETKNPADVNALGKGLYIVNGKKILL